MNTWIIGCGDIGRRVAQLYQKAGQHSNALVQSNHSAKQCQQLNIPVIQHNLDSDKVINNALFQPAQLFYFAPPPTTGAVDSRLENFLSQLQNQPKKIVLISTTGVYGDSAGAWIDENTPIAPQADRAKRRAHAEQLIIQWAQQYNKRYIILRVPGIYAPDRLPLQRLKKGLPVVNSQESAWTNRIHADDLAQVCQSAMQADISNTVYNVTDGSPSTMTDYFNQVADYAGLARPPQISMQHAVQTLSKGMVSYLQESRRIKNDKMLAELKIVLQYPNLATGLAS